LTTDSSHNNPYFAFGKNFTVEINIFNVGDSNAFDVSVVDEWPNSFAFVKGKNQAKFDHVLAGGREHFNFSVSPSFEGELEGFAAKVHYLPAENAQLQTGYSTSSRNITFLSAELYAKITAKHYREWAVFSGGLLLALLAPLFVYTQIQMEYTNGIPNKPRKGAEKSE